MDPFSSKKWVRFHLTNTSSLDKSKNLLTDRKKIDDRYKLEIERRLKMYKVLLIDDEIRIQEIVTDFFLAKGLKVICANNGIEGIEKLKEIPFDLVLLDIMMPKLDGFNTCKWI